MRTSIFAGLLLSAAAWAAPFGNDGFYTGTYYPGGANNPVYDFVSHTAAAVNGPIGDDVTANINLGSAFSFYGTSFNSVAMSTNGNIQFGSSATNFGNDPIPTTDFAGAIAAFWDDIVVPAGGSKYEYFAASPTSALAGPVSVFSWLGTTFFGTTTQVGNFQILIGHTSGKIIVQYQSVSDTDSASLGIQQNSGRGLEYSYNTANAVSERSAIVYEPGAVPEPSTYLMLTSALGALALLRRKR
jgi:hypothetical protein